MPESAGGPMPSLTGLINEIAVGDPTIEQVLERVVDLATRIIDRVDGASITLFRPDMKPFTRVASDDWVREVDRRQYETQQGPCLEVAATSAPTSGSAELANSDAWPVFGPSCAELGVHAVLAAGLSPHPDHANPGVHPPGALNLYSRSPFAFSASQREEALLLAALAGHSLQLVEARSDAERLREALSSRDVIGQAKGILMERHGIGEGEAFAILRRASNDLNVKLRDVAATIAERADSGNGTPVPDGHA
ncbi:MAG: ANTAR domain-containing protein [Propionibacteriaceae bacterium]|nr:ANTAR domain-containing protein [Propionibacteriaceae bacterium]